MGTLLSILLALPAFAAAGAGFDHSHARFDALLKTHVRGGRVDYAALGKNPEELDRYLDSLAAVARPEFERWSEPERLAFLINLYNAQTLRLILDHYGSIESIKDIGGLWSGPWDKDIVRLWGKTLSLGELEHGILRRRFEEPRVHFALNCASIGCPPLRPEAYRAPLDAQLERQARDFLGDGSKNRYEPGSRTLRLSPIFKWFRKDFEEMSGSVLSAILPYLPKEQARAAVRDRSRLRIDYTEYDWKLNDVVSPEINP